MALAGALTMDRLLRMNAPRLHSCLRSGTHSSSRLSRTRNNTTQFTRTFFTNPSRAQQYSAQRILPLNHHGRIPASPTHQASRPTKGRFTNHAGSSRTTPLLRCYSSAAASLSSDFRHSHPHPAPAPPTLDASSLDNTIISQAPLQLSTEQQFLMQQVLHNKKSVFFTGSAGTGKSVLLRQLIENLKEHYKPGQVAVTASTGIAACNIGGCTLHAFAGIGLGNGTVDQLMVKLNENRRAKARWRKTKVLIIDESKFS
ncbi:hypothetical protein K457DRAFT_514918 [Linnemannia elongata AG-77]|uniref:ATP-dependent DNA helicase n=1 Tax=Linnemannia elongata AG-77 TaxID=1314771 RepID=A0A197JW58_9FUNG|nr:hypothetical protein K457DRAFT_514918 [Linnemannia elongata AG-77]